MKKEAVTRYPINPLSKARWSPRAFAQTLPGTDTLLSLFEAARWAPSAMNEQPWRFITGIKPAPGWHLIFDTLMAPNQIWAKEAPVLMVVCSKNHFGNDGTLNLTAAYDTGQAVAHLSIEAMNQSLYVHQMGGFFPEKAITLLEIPEGFQPLVVIAIGYYGDPESLPEPYKQREFAPRTRKEPGEIVYDSKFGQPFIQLP